ncbi:MAG: rRNA pseudouridine synthase [Clostridia bacterium]|nr:rRNA pseudouridine synthase [Clostridia bacterium]
MEEFRLQKFLAHSGVASRRAAEEIIASGRVFVNDKRASDPSLKVTVKDKVTVDGKTVTVTRTKTYIIMNKPLGVLSSASDDRGRQCVVDIVKLDNVRLYPVGRLDYDTQGIILLTDDGDFMQRVTHPKYEMAKTYEALVKGEPSEDDLSRLRQGVELEDGMTLPAKADVVRFKGPNAVVKIEIREGRNRQVRRMLDAIGFPVLKLKRTAIGGLGLGDLRVGAWRNMKHRDFEDLFGKQEAKKLKFG